MKVLLNIQLLDPYKRNDSQYDFTELLESYAYILDNNNE